MDVVDAYCGVGGFSAGAIEAGCKPILGVDNHDAVLRLWAANTGGQARMATLWDDDVDWPSPRPDLHVHMSPPCTELSKARRSDQGNRSVENGLDGVRKALEWLLKSGYTSWSIENVNTTHLSGVLDKCAKDYPNRVAYTTVDASDLGAPTTRTRIIVAPPDVIKKLREIPVTRCTLRQAFAKANLELPATHMKNSTRNRHGKPCVRSVDDCAHTCCATHPLTWCNADGETVRCLWVVETAVVQGFVGLKGEWMLPKPHREANMALGNAVCPAVGCAIMHAAQDAARERQAKST